MKYQSLFSLKTMKKYSGLLSAAVVTGFLSIKMEKLKILYVHEKKMI